MIDKNKFSTFINSLKDNVEGFIEVIDDKIFDIYPCPICHKDRVLCPSCQFNENCNICNEGFICPQCNLKSYEKFQPYFDLVNSISANTSKYTQEEIITMLDEVYRKITTEN